MSRVSGEAGRSKDARRRSGWPLISFPLGPQPSADSWPWEPTAGTASGLGGLDPSVFCKAPTWLPSSFYFVIWLKEMIILSLPALNFCVESSSPWWEPSSPWAFTWLCACHHARGHHAESVSLLKREILPTIRLIIHATLLVQLGLHIVLM